MYFQVWNVLFAPRELQSETVRDEWNIRMSEQLSSELKLHVIIE